jgi:DNA repair exonuclease SbcCD ATPase subunit
MLQFHSLMLQGLKSFGRKRVVKFHGSPGLIQVIGDNERGKSNLLNGIVWVLTGKTLKGQRGDSVRHWSKRYSTWAVLDFSRDGVHYRLKRTQSPNTLTLTTKSNSTVKTFTQQQLDDFLHLSWEKIRNRLIHGQKESGFIEATATEKLNKFNDLLGLTVWARLGEAARAKAAGRKKRAERWARLQSRESGSKRALVAELAETQRRQEAEKAKPAASSDDRQIISEIHKLNSICQELKIQRNLKSRQAKDAEQASKRITFQTVWRGEGRIAELRAAIANCERSIELYESGKCRTCGQDIADAERQAGISRSLLKLNAGRLAQLEESKAKFDAEQSDRRKRREEFETQAEQAGRQAAELDKSLAGARAKRNALKDEAERSAGRRSSSLRSIADRISNLREAIAKHATASHKFKSRKLRALATASRYEALAVKAKELRLWLIRRAVAQLEVNTANELNGIGLAGWRIEYRLETIKADGKVSKGFETFISSPDSREPKPWHDWSGGAQQRLKLAAECGWAALADQVDGESAGWEAWDEPTDGISAANLETVLQFFAERARRLNREVWIVDHRALKSGDFAGRYEVVKRRNGTDVVKV